MTLREFQARMKDAPTIGKTRMDVPRGNSVNQTKSKWIPIAGILETSYERGIPRFVLTKLKGEVFDKDRTEIDIDVKGNVIEISSGAYWERPHYRMRIHMDPPERRS